MLDSLDEQYFAEDYTWLLEQVQKSGKLEEYRVRDVGNTLLIGWPSPSNGPHGLEGPLMDGTDYFSSEKVHCSHCLERKDSTGTGHYRHGALVPVIVKPGSHDVLALMPEMILNEDGYEKQDC